MPAAKTLYFFSTPVDWLNPICGTILQEYRVLSFTTSSTRYVGA